MHPIYVCENSRIRRYFADVQLIPNKQRMSGGLGSTGAGGSAGPVIIGGLGLRLGSLSCRRGVTRPKGGRCTPRS
eukprot:883842-Prymnesium_polylepis.1